MMETKKNKKWGNQKIDRSPHIAAQVQVNPPMNLGTNQVGCNQLQVENNNIAASMKQNSTNEFCFPNNCKRSCLSIEIFFLFPIIDTKSSTDGKDLTFACKADSHESFKLFQKKTLSFSSQIANENTEKDSTSLSLKNFLSFWRLQKVGSFQETISVSSKSRKTCIFHQTS